MDLSKLFETQAILDKKIIDEKGLQGQDLLDKKILALQVELGELANEWQMFKFWKENPEPRTEKKVICHACKGKGEFVVNIWDEQPEFCGYCEGTGYQEDVNPMLEEYVDCLHFILGIGLEGSFDKISLARLDAAFIEHNVNVYKESDITLQFNELYFAINGYVYHESSESYQEIILCFIALGEQLGFTWEQIETAYYQKNKINHKRQKSGY